MSLLCESKLTSHLRGGVHEERCRVSSTGCALSTACYLQLEKQRSLVGTSGEMVAPRAGCDFFSLRRMQRQPTASASPWQNGFAERLIGSIRRDCADHIIVFGEAHLRRILRSYACYYNGIKTHRSLDKDAPISRPVQRTGVVNSRAILGGLHYHYARV